MTPKSLVRMRPHPDSFVQFANTAKAITPAFGTVAQGRDELRE